MNYNNTKKHRTDTKHKLKNVDITYYFVFFFKKRGYLEVSGKLQVKNTNIELTLS